MTTTKLPKTHPLTRACALASLSLTGALATTPVLAQGEVDELREQVQELQQRLDNAVAGAPEPDRDNPYLVRDGDGIKIGGTTISFDGFIKADYVAGSGGDATVNNYSVGRALNFYDDSQGESDWKTGFTARESRLAIGTETEDVAGHTLSTYLEMDFNQAESADGNETVSNSYAPRLRQAYGHWNGWTLGQTYTTFTDLAALPEVLNQGKMAAFIYATQGQVRYTTGAPGGKLMMALENPEDGIRSVDISYDDQSYPDLTARYQTRSRYGHYSISGVLRNMEHDTSGEDDEELAGAVSASARIPTIGRDDLRLQYSYGHLGRYMGLLTYPDTDLAAQAAGEVEPLKSSGATAAYRHYWSPSWRSNLVLSRSKIEDDLEAGSGSVLRDFDQATSIQANLIWQAHEHLQLGVEYAHWDFNEISGGNAQYEQVMGSAKLSF